MPLLCIVQTRHAAFYKFSNFNTTMLLHSRNGLEGEKKKLHAALAQALYYLLTIVGSTQGFHRGHAPLLISS
jgi:hypothetical protein